MLERLSVAIVSDNEVGIAVLRLFERARAQRRRRQQPLAAEPRKQLSEIVGRRKIPAPVLPSDLRLPLRFGQGVSALFLEPDMMVEIDGEMHLARPKVAKKRRLE